MKNYFKSAFQFLRGNPEIFFLDIVILTLSLSFFGFFLFWGKIAEELIEKAHEKADFSIYFKAEIDETKIEQIKDEIMKNFGLEARIRTKEEALEAFRFRHKENQVILKALEEVGNPFLSSLEIKVKDPQKAEEIVKYFKEKEDLVEKIDYFQRKPIIEKIFWLTQNIKKFTLKLLFVFLFASFLAILVTLRISISNFKDEILIQKIVGASDFKITFPFVFESFWIGFLSSLFSFFILVLTVLFLSPFFESFLSDIQILKLFKMNWPKILLFQFLVGIGFSTISTVLATRKYLS